MEAQPREHPDHTEHTVQVTVLFDGQAHEKNYPLTDTVAAVIKQFAHQSADDYQLTDQRLGTGALANNLTLTEAGIQSGDILSITKKHGGGGAQCS